MMKKKFNVVSFFMIFIIVPITIPTSTSDTFEPFFQVDLIYPTCGGPPCYEWVPPFAFDLRSIGIDVTRHLSLTSRVHDLTLRYPGPFPIPTHDEGGFDFLIWPMFDYDFEWPASEQFGTSGWIPNGTNFYQYSSSEFDTYASLYDQAINWDDRIDYLQEMQQILYEDLPSIGVYYHKRLYAIKDYISNFDLVLWEEEQSSLANWLIENQTILRIADSFGGAYAAHPYLFYDYYKTGWFEQIFNGLLMHEYQTHRWVPSLALNYTTSDRLNWTFNLDPDARWADGTNLTADDVLFSYKTMLSPIDLSSPFFRNKYYLKLVDYMDNSSITKLDNYTIQFSLKKFNFNAEKLFSYPIIPAHIYKPISDGGTGPEYIDWYNETLDWAENYPEKIFGAGPYKVQSWNIVAGILHLVENPYYQNLTSGFNSAIDEIIFYNGLGQSSSVEKFNNSEIDFIGEEFLVTWEYEEDDFVDAFFLEIPSGYIIELAFNNLHPIFGTGELCPIPGEESAKHVRKAINYILKREYLIETDWRIQGYADPAYIPFPEFGLGYNSSLLPFVYSLDLAKYHMREAGYDIPENIGTSKNFGIPFLYSLALLGLIGGSFLFQIKKKRI